MSRFPSRLAVLPGAAIARVRHPVRRPPTTLRRVLVAHHLLLGDTMMLTPLLAKLRANHPDAEVVMTLPRAIHPLYARRPYGVVPLAYDPHDAKTLPAILDGDAGYDLAIVPGDNRTSWLAMAAGARWIRAFAGDTPGWKNWLVDEAVPYPDAPAAWGDMVADLVAGAAPAPYKPSDWPSPPCEPFALPRATRYAVLHVGASTPLKLWEAAKWQALAAWLDARGIVPVFSGGRGEDAIVATIDPRGERESFAGRLSLPQLWRLLERARVLVAPDTGVAHLGRIVGVPTVTLFGPGSAIVSGPGRFWRRSPSRAVTIPDFPCRDQHRLFRREIPWVERCGRGLGECPAPRCMHAIDTDRVEQAIDDLLKEDTRA